MAAFVGHCFLEFQDSSFGLDSWLDNEEFLMAEIVSNERVGLPCEIAERLSFC